MVAAAAQPASAYDAYHHHPLPVRATVVRPALEARSVQHRGGGAPPAPPLDA